ncbi:MAG: LPS assembly lipoprotein LptE [Granulosicoccaceae bacterium]|jgi:LPS-assembly lipoprotein
MSTRRSIIVVLLAVMLTGCGFHLRGEVSVPDNMRVVTIDGIAPYSEFAVAVKRALASNGISVVENASGAQAIIKLSNLRFDRRVLTVSSVSGKVREYELSYSVEMRVVDNAGKQLLAPYRLRQVRDYLFDENDVLGKSTEEAQLRKEMQADLIQQLLRRLQARQAG